jgi:hypothetical protein
LDAARAIPEVVSASRRIITGGLITNREGAYSISLMGIEPESEQMVSLVAANIKPVRLWIMPTGIANTVISTTALKAPSMWLKRITFWQRILLKRLKMLMDIMKTCLMTI